MTQSILSDARGEIRDAVVWPQIGIDDPREDKRQPVEEARERWYDRTIKLELSDGAKFTTPSAAAIHITGSNVNGWRFWKCKLPGASQFVLIERLRGKSH